MLLQVRVLEGMQHALGTTGASRMALWADVVPHGDELLPYPSLAQKNAQRESEWRGGCGCNVSWGVWVGSAAAQASVPACARVWGSPYNSAWPMGSSRVVVGELHWGMHVHMWSTVRGATCVEPHAWSHMRGG